MRKKYRYWHKGSLMQFIKYNYTQTWIFLHSNEHFSFVLEEVHLIGKFLFEAIFINSRDRKTHSTVSQGQSDEACNKQ